MRKARFWARVCGSLVPGAIIRVCTSCSAAETRASALSPKPPMTGRLLGSSTKTSFTLESSPPSHQMCGSMQGAKPVAAALWQATSR